MDHFGSMKFVRAPCGDEGDAACTQMRTELTNLDEIFFLGLCSVALEGEWIASEIV